MIQEPHPSGTDERGSDAPAPSPTPVPEPAPRRPSDEAGQPVTAPVQVAVKRTGGFAGLTKQWRAEPPADEASVWISLISQCPWDAPDSLAADRTGRGDGTARGESSDGRPPAGADRFTWWIQARCGDTDEREAEVPDGALVGAWRELVDAVRDWSRQADG